MAWDERRFSEDPNLESTQRQGRGARWEGPLWPVSLAFRLRQHGGSSSWTRVHQLDACFEHVIYPDQTL